MPASSMAWKKTRKRARVGLARVREVPDRARVEEEAEHPADRGRAELDAGLAGRARRSPSASVASSGLERLVDSRRARAGAASRGPPPSRAGCPRACPPGRRGPSGAICSISSRRPAVGRRGQPAADDLAEAGEIGRHAVALLRAAAGDPEAGHHLVEDQQRAVLDRTARAALRGSPARAARSPCCRPPARR